MTVLVSIIVPTRNSAETIETCIKSVMEQTYRRIEIIVVDCFSRDRTREIADSYGARVIESEVKRAEARNIGAEKAKGSLIFFVDSDMELDSSVVDECVNEVGNGCDAVIVPEVSIGEGFWAKCKALEKSCYMGDHLIEAARFFKKSVFKGMGGYDLELEAGEDWDLNQRISNAKHRIERINSSIKHHEGRLSLRETLLKKHYYGKTIECYRRKHPEEAKEQLRLIRPAFLRNWRKLTGEPILALGMFLMKACEFEAAGLGHLTSKRN